METKKSTEANIEKLRFPITLTALLFIGSIVLASFTYTNGIERDSNEKVANNSAEIQFIQDVATPDEPEPQIEVPPTVIPPDQNIRIDSNDQIEPPKFVVDIKPPDIQVGTDIVDVKPPVIPFPDVEAKFDPNTMIGHGSVDAKTSPVVAMQLWIADNVQYPQTAIEMNEQGRVYMSFVVELDGSITDIKVERGVSTDLDREAKRLLRKMPKWVAGEAKGKKVRTRCRLPINFTLN